MSRRIFLSGMMGCGKTTVGHELARLLGVELLDLDARIEQRVGMSIPELFERRGEGAFRALEADEASVVARMSPPAVVALGGGTVMRRDTRRMLLREGTLITLTASPEELARRLEGKVGRPLLEPPGAAADILRELLDERASAYAECHAAISTMGRDVGDIARRVRAAVVADPVVVPLGLRTYRVHIGHGRIDDVAPRIEAMAPSSAVVVTDDNVVGPWASRVAERLEPKMPVTRVVLEPGEQHKTLDAVALIWDAALGIPVDRQSVVVSVGGGVAGDLAGFCAATLLRGVRTVMVPTSLLAMADASVGGKTGFDRPEGKNLVGAFHQPEVVVCALETLSTLPDVELRSGLGEVVKAAWLSSEAAVSMLERDAGALLARDPEATERAVRMAVRLKAEVVADDELEAGRRAVLNLGHTLGHAIEAAHAFTGPRHGEAVALGMIGAFRVARALSDGGESVVAQEERLTALLARLGLPTDLDARVDERTLGFLASDKKRQGDRLRFVLPGAPGETDLREIPLETLRRTLRGSG